MGNVTRHNTLAGSDLHSCKVQKGIVAPTAVTPAFEGQLYVDTAADRAYIAYGLVVGNWLEVSSTVGTVVGPASSVDNTLPRFNGTTGVLLKTSGVIVDNSNNMTIPGTLTLTTSLLMKGVSSGTLTHSVPAAVTSHALLWPAAQGAAGTYLRNDGAGNLSWATETGLGDVTGPGSSLNKGIPRFDGTTGKLLQGSVGEISDSGLLSGLVGMNITEQSSSPGGSPTPGISTLWIKNTWPRSSLRLKDGAGTDSLVERSFDATVSTSDATVTTLAVIGLDEDEVALLEARVIARGTAGSEWAGYLIRVLAYRDGAGVAAFQGPVQADFSEESTGGIDATFDTSGNSVRIRVTGVSATNLDWQVVYTRVSLEA